jgi:1,4-alpha-glucan branching enzyme
MTTGTMVQYAEKRTRDHLVNFTNLYEQIKRRAIDENYLSGLEGKNNIFPQIDYRVYLPSKS